MEEMTIDHNELYKFIKSEQQGLRLPLIVFFSSFLLAIASVLGEHDVKINMEAKRDDNHNA